MKTQILSFVLIFLPSILFAQIQLTGKIINKENKAVELVEVQISNKDSILVNSVITDEQGNFSLTIDKGDYSLIVKQLGVILHKQSISLNESLDLGNISITQKQQQLKDVIITSKKKLIERKVDRLVFNVENSITAIGGDALDVLKITPNIRLQNDQITIIGKNKISIMIDDKLVQLSGDDLINFLKTIMSENIKNIEVITAPPAKYDADGNSGLLNIRLKKSKKDYFSGNAKTSYTQAKYGTHSFGTGISYQKNKFTLISGFDFTKGIIAPIQKYDMFYPNYLWRENYDTKNKRSNNNQRIALDYKINRNTNIGIEYNRVVTYSDIKSINNSKIIGSISNQLDSIIETNAVKNVDRSTQSLNFHTVTKLDTVGRNISFDLDYFDYNYNIDNNFNTITQLSNGDLKPNRSFFADNIGSQNIKIYSSKLDFELPLKYVTLSFGAKLSVTKNNNESIFYNIFSNQSILNETRTNKFIYNENNHALYISANKDLSKKWSVQLGLRLENTISNNTLINTNTIYKNNYTELFPTFYLNYVTESETTFSVNYSRRIERPSYNLLNPFRIYSTSTNYTEGNPYLTPYFSNNIEFSCTKGNFYHSLYFNYFTKGIDQITFTNESLY